MLTNEQFLALKSAKHLAVTANAGSGKTMVLVERYINLLFNDPEHDPKRILALTFTRKAASEMKSKVIKKIQDEIKEYNASTSTLNLSELYELRQKMTSAHISTIHSFCSSLLRDYPIEAGINPNFVELSDVDKYKIRKNAIETAMQEWIDPNNQEKYVKAKILFSYLGLEKIKEYLEYIYNSKENLDEMLEFYDKWTDKELFNNILNSLLTDLINTFGPLVKFIKKHITFILDKKPSKTQVDAFKEFPNRIAENIKLAQEIQSSNELSYLETSEFINTCLRFKFFKIGPVYANTFVKGRFKNDQALQDEFCTKFDAFSNAASLFEDVKFPKNEDELSDYYMLGFVRILLQIFLDARKYEKQEKDRISGIDFDDMILLARDILNDDFIKKELRFRYRHILIDEFQDTNWVQFEIIKKLVSEYNDKINEIDEIDENTLFIVGDEKQSIYGFRNADIRVFKESRERIKEINSRKNGAIKEELVYEGREIKYKNPDEELGDIRLLESFRMMPNLAAFINIIGKNIFKIKATEFDVDYDELVFAKDSEKLESFLTGNDINKSDTISLPDNFGRIDILTEIKMNEEDDKSTVNDDEQEEENAEGESEKLANYILRMVYDEKEIEFKDIAVLGRSGKNFKYLINAFQKYGIPFIMNSGSGFYDTQEVMDIISFIKFLHDQKDDIALAAILKSPFFCVSEEVIYEITRQHGVYVFWEKMQLFCSLLAESGKEKGEKYKNLIFALNKLKDLIGYAHRIPVSRLIRKILSSGGWFGASVGTPFRPQMEANIEKLINHARTFENRGFKNLYDFVEELKILSAESNDSEAINMTSENAVQILTVHASKGLQFKVVCLYDMNKKNKSDYGFTYTPKYGLSHKVPDPESNNLLDLVSPLIHKLNHKYKSLINTAEEKRLFYVALTRAEERLILTSTLKMKKNNTEFNKINGFMSFLFEGLKINPEDIYCNEVKQLSFYYPLLWNNQRNGEKERLNIKININIINKLQIEKKQEVLKVENEEQSLTLLDDMPVNISEITFSASKIMTFEKSNKEYLNKYLYGMPALPDYSERNEDNGENKAEKAGGTFEGILVHEIMSFIKEWINDKENGRLKVSNLFDKILRKMDKQVAPGDKERMINSCLKLVELPMVQKVNLKDIETEYEVYMPWEDDFLTGSIDLLVKGEDVIEIWDWKTNFVRNKEEMLQTAKHYDTQMAIYSMLMSKMYKGRKSYNARLIFTRLADPAKAEEEWSCLYSYTSEDLVEFEKELKTKTNNIKSEMY